MEAAELRPADFLAPITLDLKLSGGRSIQEYFAWNVMEPEGALRTFVERLCSDLSLQKMDYAAIMQSIQQQIAEFTPYDRPHMDAQMEDAEVPELRVPIRVEFAEGATLFRDQFEWDLNDPNGKEFLEPFVEGMCADVGLEHDAYVRILHSVREQISSYERAAASNAPELRKMVLPPVTDADVVRDASEAATWGPEFEILSEAEREKYETRKDREERYRRRNQGAIGLVAVRSSRRVAEDETRRESRQKVVRAFDIFSAEQKVALKADPDHKDLPPPRYVSIIDGAWKTMTEKERDCYDPEMFDHDDPLGDAASNATGVHVAIEKYLQSNPQTKVMVDYFSSCTHCHTSRDKSPMMRKGPDGLNSLCNACGLYYARHGMLP